MAKLTVASIQRQIAKLQEKAKKLEQVDKEPAIKQILALMLKNGVSIQELRKSGGKVDRKSNTKRQPVKPKYQHPHSGQTWTGRGLTPKWLTEAEKAGQLRDSFLIPS
jgi:DNA-binding protein H-NS